MLSPCRGWSHTQRSDQEWLDSSILVEHVVACLARSAPKTLEPAVKKMMITNYHCSKDHCSTLAHPLTSPTHPQSYITGAILLWDSECIDDHKHSSTSSLAHPHYAELVLWWCYINHACVGCYLLSTHPAWHCCLWSLTLITHSNHEVWSNYKHCFATFSLHRVKLFPLNSLHQS